MVKYLHEDPVLCGHVMRDGGVCARREGHKADHANNAALERRRNRERGNPIYREKIDAANAARAQERRQFLDAYKLKHGCVDCGYTDHPAALEFDHLPGSDKLAPVGNLVLASMERLMAEIAKCEVVCANCHRIRTTDREQWKNRVKR